MTTNLERLERNINKLNEGDQQIAWSLLRSAKLPRLTEMQWLQVEKLLQKIGELE